MDNSVDQGKDLLRSITGQLSEILQVGECHTAPQFYAPIPPVWMRISFGAVFGDLKNVVQIYMSINTYSNTTKYMKQNNKIW